MALACNVGGVDRIIRLVLGILFLLIAIFVPITGGLKFLVVVLAAIGIGTGLLKFCPLNRALGINTCGK